MAAQGDTATLIVALSAQLTKFEKEMKDAVGIADKRTKEIEGVFGKMNTAIEAQMSTLAATAGRAFGPIGGFLAGLNPVAVGIAAAVGGLVLVFNQVSEQIDKFVEKSKALKDTSDLTGLTASQLKALQVAGREVGVPFETIEKGVIKFAAAFEELRQSGTGPLFEALRRFPGLARDVAQAADVSEAINLVSKAVATLTDQEEKLGVTSKFTGVKQAGFLRLFELIGPRDLINVGNLGEAGKEFDAMTNKIVTLSREIEDIQRKRNELFKGAAIPKLEAEKAYQQKLLDIQKNLQDLAESRDELFAAGLAGGSGAELGLIEAAMQRQEISKAAAQDRAQFLPIVTDTSKATDELTGKTKDWEKALKAGLQVAITQWNEYLAILGDSATLTDKMIQKQNELQAAVNKGTITPQRRDQLTADFAQQLQAQVDAARERLGVATSEERIQARINQLKADAAKLELSETDAARARQFIREDEANRIAQIRERFGVLTLEERTQAHINAMLTEAAKTSMSLTDTAKARQRIQLDAAQELEADRERLGIATEQEIIVARLAKLEQDRVDKNMSALDVEKARLLILKESKETAESLAIRRSNLPDVTRFGQDATNTFKQVDQALVSTASNFENAFADIAVGTKTVAKAFHDLADSIIRDLVRMVIKMTVTGPLLKALGGMFSIGGTGLFGSTGLNASSSVAALTGVQNTAGWSTDRFLGMRQSGGPVAAGSPYLVGEHGPELFVPRNSGQIVPNAINRGGAAAGFKVTVNNYAAGQVDTTQQTRQQGPNVEELVIGIVKRTLASGEADSSNRARFGLRPNKVR